jgi:2-enoate reductase
MNYTSAMFEPWKIGNVEIKNRVTMVAMGIHSKRMVNSDCSYTQDGIDYFAERAKGGVGLIITGGLAVQNKFESIEGGNSITNSDGVAFVANMKKLTDEVHKYGTKIISQLGAGSGRTAPVWFMSGEAIGPSDGLPNVWKPEIKHRALTKDEIELYLQGFEVSAKLCKDAGFDGVEIHAMHEGYLLDQFSLKNMNTRDDEYGGPVLENRLRFVKEIAERIHAACGDDFPVLMRYSVTSKMKGYNQGALPGETFEEFGRDREESVEVAKLLQKYGYAALDADNGTYDSWFWAHPPVYMPEACNLDDCAFIKEHVDIPVICAGRMENPEIGAKAIAEGKIDSIGLARSLLADPEWAKKVEKGDVEDIRPCIACHVGCLQRIFNMKDMSCALNPTCCNERAYELKPAAETRNVMVIGGGIAGMEAARVCALRGHNVHLYEKTNVLGGMFIAASSMSFKKADKKLIEWYKHQMEKTGVKVHLNCEVTIDMVKEASPDVVYVATGSKARKLQGVAGAEKPHVISAVDALLNKTCEGENVVIVGGGLTGIEIAYDKALAGKHVNVVEMLPQIFGNKQDLCAANENMLRMAIQQYKIGIHTEAKLVEIRDHEVVIEKADEQVVLPADCVICSIGYIPNNGLLKELQENGIRVESLGDCDHVSNLMGAIWKAFESAKEI